MNEMYQLYSNPSSNELRLVPISPNKRLQTNQAQANQGFVPHLLNKTQVHDILSDIATRVDDAHLRDTTMSGIRAKFSSQELNYLLDGLLNIVVLQTNGTVLFAGNTGVLASSFKLSLDKLVGLELNL